ncbi:MAG: hypothetical protein B6226_03915, partial [Candidatus Cloacimonetes bacterium 4572_65]
MKKLLLISLLSIMTISLFATLDIDIQFDTDVVGDAENGTYTSEFFHITNTGDTAEYTIDIEYTGGADSWFMTWCHEGLDDYGILEGCHHHSQPWSLDFPAGAVMGVDFQVNGMGAEDGMLEIEYIITGGDLTEPIILPFTYRTTDFVSNSNDVEVPTMQFVTNYPNPFNPETTISLNLTKAGNLDINIFNMKGQIVNSLFSGRGTSGSNNF